MMSRWLVVVFAGVLLWSAQVRADDAVARGRKVAENVCAACHVIGRDAPPPAAPHSLGPAFGEIADRPATSEQGLRQFVSGTHWDLKSGPVTMPNPLLTPQQVADVARYIMSLRTPAAGSRAPSAATPGP